MSEGIVMSEGVVMSETGDNGDGATAGAVKLDTTGALYGEP